MWPDNTDTTTYTNHSYTVYLFSFSTLWYEVTHFNKLILNQAV